MGEAYPIELRERAIAAYEAGEAVSALRASRTRVLFDLRRQDALRVGDRDQQARPARHVPSLFRIRARVSGRCRRRDRAVPREAQQDVARVRPHACAAVARVAAMDTSLANYFGGRRDARSTTCAPSAPLARSCWPIASCATRAPSRSPTAIDSLSSAQCSDEPHARPAEEVG